MRAERWLNLLPARADTPDGITYFEAGHRFRRRPHARLEATVSRRGPGYDWFVGLRFVVGRETRAWVRVDDWFDYAEIALAGAPNGAAILPHIRSGDVESKPNWVNWFRDRLTMPESPLYQGLWQLAEFSRVDLRDSRHACAPRLPRWTQAMPWPRAFETEAFYDVVPMRAASASDSGRVRWYRKLAQEEKLPPVLMMYSAAQFGWFVLDGHDRLVAAALEGKTPTYVGLSAVLRRPFPVDLAERQKVERALAESLACKPEDQRAVEGVNRALIALYEDCYLTLRQRAWPLPGGVETWRRELASLSLDSQLLSDMLASAPE